MTLSTRLIVANVAVVTLVALLWLQAPVIPAITGAVGAGALLYFRARRAAA